MNLHYTCDCFVMPSFGESWCIPAFDAMAMGKTPICTNIGGMADFIGGKTPGGWLVSGYDEPVFGATDTFGDLYTGYEQWRYISINELRKAMRQVYKNEAIRKERSENGMANAYNYSLTNVGNIMRELLEN
jgi:glycosyltransferase involved in cell wall biosynthesis